MFKNHPKGLFVAFFTNMGERFGFYTMMAILVLFLQAKYGLTEKARPAIITAGSISVFMHWPWLADCWPTVPGNIKQ